MKKIHVGVLRGGTSREYETSLKSGANILKNLPERYIGHDILITKDGVWHFEGLPVAPEKLFRKVDVVFNALHGTHSNIQNILKSHHFPHTGSGALASSVSAHKGLSKKVLASYKIKTLHSMEAYDEGDSYAQSLNIFRKISLPASVKPLSSHSNIQARIAKSFLELEAALKQAFKEAPAVLIEEHISGKLASCIVLDHFRGERHYSIFPIETINKIVPGNFSRQEKTKIQDIAKHAHQALGLEHYSQMNFVVHPKRGVYFIGANAFPELEEDSLLAHSLQAVGASMPHFIEHTIELARKRK